MQVMTVEKFHAQYPTLKAGQLANMILQCGMSESFFEMLFFCLILIFQAEVDVGKERGVRRILGMLKVLTNTEKSMISGFVAAAKSEKRD